jgi:hypothetical protein
MLAALRVGTQAVSSPNIIGQMMMGESRSIDMHGSLRIVREFLIQLVARSPTAMGFSTC